MKCKPGDLVLFSSNSIGLIISTDVSCKCMSTRAFATRARARAFGVDAFLPITEEDTFILHNNKMRRSFCDKKILAEVDA